MTAVAPEPRLSDFYLRLADDPSLLEQYERDPEAALGRRRQDARRSTLSSTDRTPSARCWKPSWQASRGSGGSLRSRG